MNGTFKYDPKGMTARYEKPATNRYDFSDNLTFERQMTDNLTSSKFSKFKFYVMTTIKTVQNAMTNFVELTFSNNTFIWPAGTINNTPVSKCKQT